MRPASLALGALACLFSTAHAACAISRTAVIAVYADTAGGVSNNSAVWTRAFFTWLVSGNPGLEVAYITDATQISSPGGCNLSSLPALKLWVQPGGDALNQSVALGSSGRDNLVAYVGLPGRSVLATSAGWYFSSGDYWMGPEWYPHNTMPRWWPAGAWWGRGACRLLVWPCSALRSPIPLYPPRSRGTDSALVRQPQLHPRTPG